MYYKLYILWMAYLLDGDTWQRQDSEHQTDLSSHWGGCPMMTKPIMVRQHINICSQVPKGVLCQDGLTDRLSFVKWLGLNTALYDVLLLCCLGYRLQYCNTTHTLMFCNFILLFNSQNRTSMCSFLPSRNSFEGCSEKFNKKKLCNIY
jgi:hypothetical protein